MPNNVANSAIACEGRALKLRFVPKTMATMATRPVPAYKCRQGVGWALPGLSIVVAMRRVKGSHNRATEPHTEPEA